MKWTAAILVVVAAVASVSADSCIGTLYAADPFQDGVSLPNGLSASVTNEYQLVNRQTDIDFGGGGVMRVVPEGNRQAAVVDLGSEGQLSADYGALSSPRGAMYTSLHWDADSQQVLILKDYSKNTFQPLHNDSAQKLTIMDSTASFLPTENHVYLLNMTSSSHTGPYLAKMLVLVSDPYKAVTMRWDVIESSFDCRCLVNPKNGAYILGGPSAAVAEALRPATVPASGSSYSGTPYPGGSSAVPYIALAVALLAAIAAVAALVLVALPIFRQRAIVYKELN